MFIPRLRDSTEEVADGAVDEDLDKHEATFGPGYFGMNPTQRSTNPSNRRPRLASQGVTEATARERCRDLSEREHDLGARRSKGRSLYQVVCRDDMGGG